MPSYEHTCETNGRVVEVQRKMAERLRNWGELCERAGIKPGKTTVDAPVVKLMSSGFLGMSGASKENETPRCETGVPCYGGGMYDELAS